MTNLVGPINSGAASGGSGVATANDDSTNRVIGQITAVYVAYNDSPPATTDVTIKTTGTASGAPGSNTILTLSNNATAGWYYPRHQVHDETGTGVTYDGTNEVYEAPFVSDTINVTIAQANDDDNVDVWLIVC